MTKRAKLDVLCKQCYGLGFVYALEKEITCRKCSGEGVIKDKKIYAQIIDSTVEVMRDNRAV